MGENVLTYIEVSVVRLNFTIMNSFIFLWMDSFGNRSLLSLSVFVSRLKSSRYWNPIAYSFVKIHRSNRRLFNGAGALLECKGTRQQWSGPKAKEGTRLCRLLLWKPMPQRGRLCSHTRRSRRREKKENWATKD